jgi:hypothetical protein
VRGSHDCFEHKVDKQYQQMYTPSEIVRDVTSQTNSHMQFSKKAFTKKVLCSLTFNSVLNFTI